MVKKHTRFNMNVEKMLERVAVQKGLTAADLAHHLVSHPRINARAREVTSRRFGLLGAEFMTLEALAEKYSVSRERIRQIESKTLRQICYAKALLKRDQVD